jgi:thymidine phosphorylase
MKREEDALRLAEVMVETGRGMGKKMVALITDMDQPLGRAAGHANEVIECIDVLNGKGPADLRALSVELSAWMFYLGEKTSNVAEGRKLAEELIATGAARDKFKENIRLQGGDQRVIDDPTLLPRATSQDVVTSTAKGCLEATDCERLGIALAILGGGRETKEDRIDHAVGLMFHKRLGDAVEKGEPLVTIHYNSGAKLAEAKRLIGESFLISDEHSTAAKPLIRRILGV